MKGFRIQIPNLKAVEPLFVAAFLKGPVTGSISSTRWFMLSYGFGRLRLSRGPHIHLRHFSSLFVHRYRHSKPVRMAPKPMNFNDGPLVWIDCEMTGLDPQKDRILEIAVRFEYVVLFHVIRSHLES